MALAVALGVLIATAASMAIRCLVCSDRLCRSDAGTPVLLQLFVIYYGSRRDQAAGVHRRAARTRLELRRL
jgi:ABC-type arginine/histidine transport system permease subunit